MAEATKIFRTLKPPVYFLAGNNEINLNQPLKGKEAWTRHFGPLISGVDLHGVRLVFAYTDPLEQGVSLNGYDPFEAVQAQLEQAGTKPVILFHHAPSVADFYKNSFHEGWTSGLKARWQTLLDNHKVQAVIAGHFHRDEFHWLGKIPLYVSGPVVEKYGRQACFRIYEYNQGRLGYTAQYLE
ncbi:MAG: metallophosphoesterase [Desulfobacter sp.]|nr:metallophosphoesterase [Desulfobacter sp.]